MKIITIVGARPQFIKAAAFSRALDKQQEEIIVHTGQHFDSNMSKIFFDELEIPEPKYNLGISGGNHGEMTGKMIAAIETVLIKEKPDWMLLYGDTNSTMAGGLAAVKLCIPIAHVEAGCRGGRLSNPEEVNRVVTDRIAQLLFAPTEIELHNLEQENLAENAHIVGNIMYDSYLYAKKRNRDNPDFLIYDLNHNRVILPEQYYYLTCHRQENTNDDALINILRAMNQLEAPTIYPVHPRNRGRIKTICNLEKLDHIILLEPLGYFESIKVLMDCIKVVTDSGGLQCEAFYEEKQCITVLDFTPWPQTLVGNRNQLSRPDTNEILRKLNNKMEIDKNYHPFGNGYAAEKILTHIVNYNKKV